MSVPDTIVAVSSPPGRSWRGLVRVSGPEAWQVVRGWCPSWSFGRRGVDRVSVKAGACGALPAWLCCMPSPGSFTGEDTAELQVPGQPALLERLLHQALSHGARLAEPGEFSYRAFSNGRIDLTRAEGIAATIAAEGDAGLASAAYLREGRLARKAEAMVEALAEALARVEAGIDFVDQDDVVVISASALHGRLMAIDRELDAMLRTSRTWSASAALPRVVLAGPPSVGKSTLFNALLGRARAVVDPLPRTTRDVIEECCQLPSLHGPGIECMLVDLAGLDDSSGWLDRSAQHAAAKAIGRADVVLRLGDTPGVDVSKHPCVLRVQTRCDVDPLDASADLRVSGLTGEGLAALRQAIASRLLHCKDSLDVSGSASGGGAGESEHRVQSDPWSTLDNPTLPAPTGEKSRRLKAGTVQRDALALQPRHREAIGSALRSLREVLTLLDVSSERLEGLELIAVRLRDALDALASLGGMMTPDDVIGRVFSAFCVGK